jgi:hypothetical protein
METMAGGASFAPSLWSVSALATESLRQFGVFVDGLYDGREEQQEPQVLVRLEARIEQVDAVVRGDGPVDVLAAAR